MADIVDIHPGDTIYDGTSRWKKAIAKDGMLYSSRVGYSKSIATGKELKIRLGWLARNYKESKESKMEVADNTAIVIKDGYTEIIENIDSLDKELEVMLEHGMPKEDILKKLDREHFAIKHALKKPESRM